MAEKPENVNKPENLEQPEQKDDNGEKADYVMVPRQQLEQMAAEYQQMQRDHKELHALNDQVLQAVIDTGLMPAQGEDPENVKKRLKKVITKASSQFAKNFFKQGEADFKEIKEIKPLVNLQPVVTRINEIVQRYGHSKAEQRIREAIQGSEEDRGNGNKIEGTNSEQSTGNDQGRKPGDQDWSSNGEENSGKIGK